MAMSETNTASQYMTTKEVAALIRRSPDAVRMMRHRGEGPAGVKVGRFVLYDRKVVTAWIAAKFAADPLAQRAHAA